jgi:hypothetical protein
VQRTASPSERNEAPLAERRIDRRLRDLHRVDDEFRIESGRIGHPTTRREYRSGK